MAIRIELYGIPRQRAGVAATTVEGRCLGDVLIELERRYPDLAPTCLNDGQLQPGYTANLDGDRFVSGPEAARALSRRRAETGPDERRPHGT